MNRFLAIAALAAATIPAAAVADEMQSGAGTMNSATSATMVCRTASGNERPTAIMMDKKTAMVCKTLPDMTKPKAGPDLSGALTPDQVNAAWRKFFEMTINVPTLGGA
jgi:hypothetical protein